MKTQFEQEPLQKLANDGQLMAFKHNEFWRPMDTLRDKCFRKCGNLQILLGKFGR